jgi:penicillin-insensitive murein endopeptidase
VTRWRAFAATCALLLAPGALGADSVCYGTTDRGRLERGAQLPEAGANFRSYAPLGAMLGRTYVHSTVRDAIVDAYAALAASHPDLTFVYGETGFAGGGRFRPHKTHQNGLSVDFMVPVRHAGASVRLPRTAFNQYGYALEFDDAGRYDDYTIDFAAIGEHLYALHGAARRHGVGIRRVIFEVPLQKRLFATARGAWLRERLAFSTRPAWVRHDEHYHVDFDVPCRPL